MKRHFLAVLLAAATFALPVLAHAQDGGMTFGTEEAEKGAPKKNPDSAAAKFLDEGKKLYGKEKFAQASLLFFKVLAQKDVSAEAYYPEAQYQLGKALFRMGLYQGALSYFGKIVEAGDSHPYFLPTLRGLVLLTDVIPQDPLLLQRLAAYKDYFPKDVPEKYRDRFAYLVGRYLYTQLEVEPALKMLDSVTPRSPDYARARYIAGVTHVANYDAQPAVAAFKEVLRYLTSKQEDGYLKPAEDKLLQLTELAMARVFYSTGQYDTSVKYYGRIPRKSSRWPTALFESSWAYFQLDLYNKALGNLHSLNSPFFRHAYFPEGQILSAVIFFYNCKYDRVRYALNEFSFEYDPLKQEIEAILEERGEDPDAMFEWLKKQREEGVADPYLQQVVNTALDDLQIRRKLKLIDSINAEMKKIDSMPSQWKDSDLGSSLVGDLNLALSFAQSDAGDMTAQRLQRIDRQLEDLGLEKDKILFEVTRGEKGQIESDLRSEMDVEADVTDAPDIDVSDEELYWTFDGEYWRDELGYYLFNINSECKR